MAQNPFLMNQIAQGFDFNPGGAFFKGQQDRMGMIAAQYQQQLAQMQMAQAQAAAEQQQALRAAQGAFAGEAFGNPALGPLVDSNTVNRAMFPASSDAPSSVREYEFFLQLTPEQQRTFMDLQRAGQAMVIGGVPHIIPPGGQPQPLSTLPREVNAAGEIAGEESRARAQAQADVEEETKEPLRRQRALQTITSIDNTLANVEEALGMAGFWTTGFVGSQLANIAGTPAADFKGITQSIQASLGFDTLQQMRNSSPTGGALGAISERELTLLTAAIKSLEQAQSPGQVVRNLQAVQRHYKNWRDIVSQDALANGARQQPPTAQQPAQSQGQRMRYNPETGQLEPQ